MFLTPNMKITGTKSSYKLHTIVGEGAYGRVWNASCEEADAVAIKVSKRSGDTHIAHECTILMTIGDSFAPTFYDYGKTKLGHDFMVMELLSRDLWTMRNQTKKKIFSMDTTMYIARETFNALRYLHNAGFVMNDFKPGNVAVSLVNKRQIKIFDFGVAQKYLDDTGNHVEIQPTTRIRGTIRYACTRAHLLYTTTTRLDDLETWIYSSMEHSSPLPWTTCKNTVEVYEMKKRVAVLDDHTFSTAWPVVFKWILNLITAYHTYQPPPYDYIEIMMAKAVDAMGLNINLLDWLLQEEDDEGYVPPPFY